MSRTVKEGAAAHHIRGMCENRVVKRHHYDSHVQLTVHLHDFIDAYNYGRRLKTLKGITPFEYICKIWTTEPDTFTLNPNHQRPGLND